MHIKIENIDFKALAKECKTQEDLAGLTKQFMKNMIEGMLQAEPEEHLEENGKDLPTGESVAEQNT